MKNTGWIVIGVLAVVGLLTYFGWNQQKKMQIERQLYNSRILSAEDSAEQAQRRSEEVIDSSLQVLNREVRQIERYKDSITYSDLKSVKCYDQSNHRHSCVEFNKLK